MESKKVNLGDWEICLVPVDPTTLAPHKAIETGSSSADHIEGCFGFSSDFIKDTKEDISKEISDMRKDFPESELWKITAKKPAGRFDVQSLDQRKTQLDVSCLDPRAAKYLEVGDSVVIRFGNVSRQKPYIKANVVNNTSDVVDLTDYSVHPILYSGLWPSAEGFTGCRSYMPPAGTHIEYLHDTTRYFIDSPSLSPTSANMFTLTNLIDIDMLPYEAILTALNDAGESRIFVLYRVWVNPASKVACKLHLTSYKTDSTLDWDIELPTSQFNLRNSTSDNNNSYVNYFGGIVDNAHTQGINRSESAGNHIAIRYDTTPNTIIVVAPENQDTIWRRVWTIKLNDGTVLNTTDLSRVPLHCCIGQGVIAKNYYQSNPTLIVEPPATTGVPVSPSQSAMGAGRDSKMCLWVQTEDYAWPEIWRKSPKEILNITGTSAFIVPPNDNEFHKPCIFDPATTEARKDPNKYPKIAIFWASGVDDSNYQTVKALTSGTYARDYNIYRAGGPPKAALVGISCNSGNELWRIDFSNADTYTVDTDLFNAVAASSTNGISGGQAAFFTDNSTGTPLPYTTNGGPSTSTFKISPPGWTIDCPTFAANTPRLTNYSISAYSVDPVSSGVTTVITNDTGGFAYTRTVHDYRLGLHISDGTVEVNNQSGWPRVAPFTFPTNIEPTATSLSSFPVFAIGNNPSGSDQFAAVYSNGDGMSVDPYVSRLVFAACHPEKVITPFGGLYYPYTYGGFISCSGLKRHWGSTSGTVAGRASYFGRTKVHYIDPSNGSLKWSTDISQLFQYPVSNSTGLNQSYPNVTSPFTTSPHPYIHQVYQVFTLQNLWTSPADDKKTNIVFVLTNNVDFYNDDPLPCYLLINAETGATIGGRVGLAPFDSITLSGRSRRKWCCDFPETYGDHPRQLTRATPIARAGVNSAGECWVHVSFPMLQRDNTANIVERNVLLIFTGNNITTTRVKDVGPPGFDANVVSPTVSDYNWKKGYIDIELAGLGTPIVVIPRNTKTAKRA